MSAITVTGSGALFVCGRETTLNISHRAEKHVKSAKEYVERTTVKTQEVTQWQRLISAKLRDTRT